MMMTTTAAAAATISKITKAHDEDYEIINQLIIIIEIIFNY